jgi:hypothetical protein
MTDDKKKASWRSFPISEAHAMTIVNRYYNHAALERHFGDLDGKIDWIVTPSTSGANTIPFWFAWRLRYDFGGHVIDDWHEYVKPPSWTEKHERYIGRHSLSRIKNLKNSARIRARKIPCPKDGRILVIVDDSIATGTTTEFVKDLIGSEWITAVCLTASEFRRVTPSDALRIARKLERPESAERIHRIMSGWLRTRMAVFERAIKEGTREECASWLGLTR